MRYEKKKIIGMVVIGVVAVGVLGLRFGEKIQRGKHSCHGEQIPPNR